MHNSQDLVYALSSVNSYYIVDINQSKVLFEKKYNDPNDESSIINLYLDLNNELKCVIKKKNYQYQEHTADE